MTAVAIDFVALAGADLTDMPWMPLDIALLKRSKAWLFAKRQPELGFYMINLWTAAWHERPPGSLEDDDDVLCDAAMCDPKRWPKVRDKVLHGWIVHEGRRYHPVVCAKSAETWTKKADYRRRTQAARDAKQEKRRAADNGTGGGTEPLADRDTANNTEPVASSVTEPVTRLKGEGQGEGEREGDSREDRGGQQRALDLVETPPPDPLREAVDAWNALAARAGLTQVQRLTEPRKVKLRQRLRECGGHEGWTAALGKVEASRYLTGGGRDGWRADFDFVMQQKSFTKLMEGGYDDRTPAAGAAAGQQRSPHEAHVAAFARAAGGGGED